MIRTTDAVEHGGVEAFFPRVRRASQVLHARARSTVQPALELPLLDPRDVLSWLSTSVLLRPPMNCDVDVPEQGPED